MKRFEFRLERLLELKRQAEKLAEIRQLQARWTLDVARRKESELADQIARSSSALTSHIGRPVPPSWWMAQYQYLAEMGRALQQAGMEREAAWKIVQDADRTRVRARAEAESLRLLRQRSWQDHQLVTSRIAQQRLDETVMQRWSKQRLHAPAEGSSFSEGE